MHKELQLCENSRTVSRGCHIMKQSMLTFLWWCLNITINASVFSQASCNTVPVVGVGWGWRTQLSHTGPPPSPHPHANFQHKGSRRMLHFLRLSNPKFTQAPVCWPESAPSTTPRNTIFGTCWNLSMVVTDFWAALYWYLTHVPCGFFSHFSYVS